MNELITMQDKIYITPHINLRILDNPEGRKSEVCRGFNWKLYRF